MDVEAISVIVRCRFNTTIKTDPYRLSIKMGIWRFGAGRYTAIYTKKK
ncbi:hypothetical protein KEH51_07415 [[Brevibacterium] frigoritolerans]|uniref:Uncharacterized protein n=1 Tax=Peribacillus frigoritolerans TaxID=450367 RepID=A0A941FGQ2_9BACI|nr:hypothetical protein [Peribacillus frigoritolerans]